MHNVKKYIKTTAKKVIPRKYHSLAKTMAQAVLRRLRGLGFRHHGPSFSDDIIAHMKETDRMILALLKSAQRPSPPTLATGLGAVYVGNGRVLALHPLAPFMYLDGNDAILTPRIILGDYEPGVHLALRKLVKPGWVVVEAGANQGYHTLTLAHLATPNGGKVITFEPDPRNFRILEENIRSQGLPPVVTAINKAVCHKAAKLPFYLGLSGSHSGFFSHYKDERIEVDAVPIGDVLNEMGLSPDFVRLDIEGAEALALQGMWHYLETVSHIKVMFEFLPGAIKASGHLSPSEFLERLEQIGMKFWRVEHDGTLSATEAKQMLEMPDNAWGDFVAARSLE
jgi:FkbM family methyltransferase